MPQGAERKAKVPAALPRARYAPAGTPGRAHAEACGLRAGRLWAAHTAREPSTRPALRGEKAGRRVADQAGTAGASRRPEREAAGKGEGLDCGRCRTD